tara:strand:- start:772 stop:1365 length:594 start_codon:yes stop_codon:yes gene_type:complete
MKNLVQLALFFIMVFIGFLVYKKYFKVTDKTVEEKYKIIEEPKSEKIIDQENNIIKNLKYKVKLLQNGEYEINSKFSELSYIDGVETVNMQQVVAIFINKENIKITIKSNKAQFNNLTYNTFFEEDIKVQYFDNIITSDKLSFNFKDNNITIYENVVYNGQYGQIKTDNISINIITKEIKFFMNNKNNKIKMKYNLN